MNLFVVFAVLLEPFLAMVRKQFIALISSRVR